jgi:hypothetical protein
MNWLYALAQPFVWQPARILLVAATWFVLAFTLLRPSLRPMLIASGAWTLFGLLEFEARRERADIRVDLLFTWPALCLITIICLVIALKRGRAAGSAKREEAA